MTSPFARFCTALREDRRGASAVEFALLAPVLIGLYFGLAEYCQAMMADRKVTHAAASIGDLVAQSDKVSNADMIDIFTIGRTLVAPFPDAGLKMRVTSVTVDANSIPKVDWSDGSGLTALAKGATVALPKNSADATKPFVAKGETVIMSEAQFTYDSPVDYLIKNGVAFNEVYYLRPRKSDTVSRIN